MQMVSRTDPSAIKEIAIAPSPIKVCVHVLERACTDVQVMCTAMALVEAVGKRNVPNSFTSITRYGVVTSVLSMMK